MKTIEKLKTQRDRIKYLLELPPGTVSHKGGKRVRATFKNRLKVLNKKIEKLDERNSK